MHFSRVLGRAALVLLASAFATPPLAAQRPHQAPEPEVRRLEINGLPKDLDIEDLKANIYTTATQCRSVVFALVCKFGHWRGAEERHYLNRQELKRDVLRIRVWLYKHGYREAQVDTTVIPLDEKSVAVRFDLAAGPPIVITQITVDYDTTILSRKRVEELTLLQKGEPLDLFELDSTRVFFQNALWEEGYADALVDTSSVVDPVAHTAQVQFRLVHNHITVVGPIVITGIDKVSPSTVLNSLTFRPGDVYRRSDVIESQRGLYESNLFKLATLDVPQTFDSVKTVNVILREAPLHEARVGFGFNTVDFFQTDARYTHYNLFGGARRLDVSGTLGNLGARALNGRGIFHHFDTETFTGVTGNGADFLAPTWQASISLTQPAFIRARNSLGVGVFAQRRTVPGVVIDRGYGGNLTFTNLMAPRAPLSATYRFEITRVEANGPYFCVNFGVCDTTTIDVLRTHSKLSPIALQVQSDRTDVPLASTRGYLAHGEAETAQGWTLSDYRYLRVYGDAAWHFPFKRGSAVLATHIRAGFVRPYAGPTGQAVLHPRKRFYAGGASSVRGFGENQLGPRILTLPASYLVYARDVNGNPCDVTSNAIRFCDPATAIDSSVLKRDDPNNRGNPDYFTPRPLGGTSLIEGSVEYRFPLPFGTNLRGAVFIDGAAVGERVFDPLNNGVQRTLADLVRGTGAVTPGFGVRYYSPVGPIRIDLGINPSRAENLAVVTEIDRNGRSEIIPLETTMRYSPIGSSHGIAALLNRLVLHLSIGEAY